MDYMGVRHDGAKLWSPRGMDGVVHCWHGSRKDTAPGIPHAVVTYNVDGSPDRPELRGVFAIEPINRNDPTFKSELMSHLDALQAARRYAGPEAIVAADRQFDARRVLDRLDQMRTDYVVRLNTNRKGGGAGPRGGEPLDSKGGRLLADESGKILSAKEHAHDANLVVALDEHLACDLKRGIQEPRRVEVYAKVVWLCSANAPRRPVGTPKTLIAAFTEGRKTPLVLLAARPTTVPHEVTRYRRTFFRRWRVEESIRHGKQRGSGSWGPAMEDARLLSWTGIRRMAFLVASYQTLLGRIPQLLTYPYASVSIGASRIA